MDFVLIRCFPYYLYDLFIIIITYGSIIVIYSQFLKFRMYHLFQSGRVAILIMGKAIVIMTNHLLFQYRQDSTTVSSSKMTDRHFQMIWSLRSNIFSNLVIAIEHTCRFNWEFFKTCNFLNRVMPCVILFNWFEYLKNKNMTYTQKMLRN